MIDLDAIRARLARVWGRWPTKGATAPDTLCAACGHAHRRHDPEDGNCEAHADVGLGRCPCNVFVSPAPCRNGERMIEPRPPAAPADDWAAVVAWLREQSGGLEGDALLEWMSARMKPT